MGKSVVRTVFFTSLLPSYSLPGMHRSTLPIHRIISPIIRITAQNYPANPELWSTIKTSDKFN